MPTTNTSTIGTAQDYTTIAAWEAATDNDLVTGDDIEIGEINVAGNYNESVTIAGATTDATRYRHLTVADSIWHKGVVSTTGIAYMQGNPSGRQLYVNEDNFQVSRLYISHAGQNPNSSDEAIRLEKGVTGFLASRMILEGDGSTADCDAIYIYTNAASVTTTGSIDNSLIIDWGRAGISLQQFSSGDNTVLTANVDHCTIARCQASSDELGGGLNANHVSGDASITFVFNVYNTVAVDNDVGGAGTSRDYDEYDWGGSGPPTFTWTGTHNADSDATLTTVGINTSAQQSLSSATIFDDESSNDFNPASGQALEDNGTNRQGSEPDSRQDFSTDIAGDARGTTGVEIGCYAIAAAGGATPKGVFGLALQGPFGGPIG